MSLLTIALAVMQALGSPLWIVITAALLIPPIHIYRQLQGAYRLGRASALVRTGLLVTLIHAAIIPAFALILLYLGLA
jgi:hypothetical protein